MWGKIKNQVQKTFVKLSELKLKLKIREEFFFQENLFFS